MEYEVVFSETENDISRGRIMAYWPEGSSDGGRVRRQDTASARRSA